MEPFHAENFLILVVDDVPRNLQVVGSILDRQQYSTTFAISGQQALERLETAQPDLILLDLMMPEMDGLEVCRRIKNDQRHKDIPVIFLTASHDSDNLLQAFELGAVDYVTKPFHAPELLARVRTHLDLKQTRDTLEKSLRELAIARDQALDAARVKSYFLANISHEIRTPLNAIMGIIELLSNMSCDEQQQDLLRTLTSSSAHLLKLVNSILDFSKLEAQKITLDEHHFNLRSLVDELITLFRKQATSQHLQLTYYIDESIPLNLWGDGFRLQQVLSNLVSNSIKFTKQGSVHVVVIPDPHQAATTEKIMVRFAVRDTGIGIKVEDQAKLFQSFSQVDGSNTREYGGTGLGLAICQELVHLMEGEIGVDSTFQLGSTFWFTAALTPGTPQDDSVMIQEKVRDIPLVRQDIPLVIKSSIQANNDIVQPEEPAIAYRLLIVDDNMINRTVLKKQLQLLGYEAESSENGQLALDYLSANSVDLILMDCQMPVLDGYQATIALRQNETADQHVVVVGLTAHSMPGDREKCLAAGMDDYLAKPVAIDGLREVLERWLKVEQTPSLTETKPVVVPLITQIDVQRLEEVTGGDRELQIQILQSYLQDIQKDFQQLAIALTNQDKETMQSLIHRIKGVSATLGIETVAKIAQQMELDARTENEHHLCEHLNKLNIQIKQVETDINQHYKH